MSGKGSAPRPIPDRERYEAEWDRIFRDERASTVASVQAGSFSDKDEDAKDG